MRFFVLYFSIIVRLVLKMATTTVQWTSEKGGVYMNGTRWKVSGLNWFGFETGISVLHGLWSRKMEDLLDLIKSQGFNALRIPVSVQFASDPDALSPGTNIDFSQNPNLKGLTSGKVFDYLLDRCQERGLAVVIDFHCLYPGGGIEGLWYDGTWTEQKVATAWGTVLTRWGKRLMGIDIKNEPHDAAQWPDWVKWVNRIGTLALGICPQLLILVEGLDRSESTYSCWGGSLEYVGKTTYPQVSLPANKVVYAPHQYGKGVTNNDNCATAAQWDTHFGFIRKLNKWGLIVGEWGGRDVDYPWQDAFSTYLAKMDIDSFYWCLNPNSGDTGGILLDDWRTLNTQKLVYTKRVVPSPLFLTASNPPPNNGGGGNTPPVPPVTTSFSFTQKLVNSWPNGYQYEVTVTGITQANVNTVQFVFPSSPVISQIWNVSTTPTTISPPAWFMQNPTSTFTFGFISTQQVTLATK